jgi:hypothetical protein
MYQQNGFCAVNYVDGIEEILEPGTHSGFRTNVLPEGSYIEDVLVEFTCEGGNGLGVSDSGDLLNIPIGGIYKNIGPAAGESFCSSGDALEHSSVINFLYLGYLGRMADIGGAKYWNDRLTGLEFNSPDYLDIINQIRDAFIASNEFAERFGGDSNRDKVYNAYNALFDREPDQGGWDFYTAGLDNGDFSFKDLPYILTNGAANSAGEDYKRILNKLNVANNYIANANSQNNNLGSDLTLNLLGEVDNSSLSTEMACLDVNRGFEEGGSCLLETADGEKDFIAIGETKNVYDTNLILQGENKENHHYTVSCVSTQTDDGSLAGELSGLPDDGEYYFSITELDEDATVELGANLGTFAQDDVAVFFDNSEAVVNLTLPDCTSNVDDVELQASLYLDGEQVFSGEPGSTVQISIADLGVSENIFTTQCVIPSLGLMSEEGQASYRIDVVAANEVASTIGNISGLEAGFEGERTITTSVSDDNGVSQVILNVSFDGGNTFEELAMNRVGSTNQYELTHTFSYDTNLSDDGSLIYKVTVIDGSSNTQSSDTVQTSFNVSETTAQAMIRQRIEDSSLTNTAFGDEGASYDGQGSDPNTGGVFNFEYNTEDRNTSEIDSGNASGLVIEPTTKDNLATQLNAARSFFRQIETPNLFYTLGEYSLTHHIGYGYLPAVGETGSDANSLLTSGSLTVDTTGKDEGSYSTDVVFNSQTYTLSYNINQDITPSSSSSTKSYYKDTGIKSLGYVNSGSVGGGVEYENKYFDTDVSTGTYNVTWSATEKEPTVVSVENGVPQSEYLSFEQDVVVTINKKTTSGGGDTGGGGSGAGI